jgi:hypothetical protein
MPPCPSKSRRHIAKTIDTVDASTYLSRVDGETLSQFRRECIQGIAYFWSRSPFGLNGILSFSLHDRRFGGVAIDRTTMTDLYGVVDMGRYPVLNLLIKQWHSIQHYRSIEADNTEYAFYFCRTSGPFVVRRTESKRVDVIGQNSDSRKDDQGCCGVYGTV